MILFVLMTQKELRHFDLVTHPVIEATHRTRKFTHTLVLCVCVLSMFSSLYCLFAERGTFCHEQIDWWRRISPLLTISVSHACEPPRITSTQTVHGPLIMSYLCWLMVVLTRHAHHPNPTDSSMLSTQRALLYRCIHHMIHVCSKSALPYCEE